MSIEKCGCVKKGVGLSQTVSPPFEPSPDRSKLYCLVPSLTTHISLLNTKNHYLEPDIFLPSQFYGSGGLSRKLEGEKRLMIAVLKDAVECLEKYRGSRNSVARSHYENAIEWVMDNGTDWLFSFTNICDLLGFDPQYLRDVLLKRENKYVKPLGQRVFSLAAMGGQS